MTDFCIQLHPHRCRELDLAELRARCERMATNAALVQRFAWNEGFDKHAYINLMFATERPEELWTMLGEQLYGASELGGAMRAGSMAMCEGPNGWDDYLLLHHFDPAVARDDFPGT